MDFKKMDAMSRDILMEVGNVGTGNAVTSLSAMTGYTFDVELPNIRIVKYQDVPGIVGGAESVQTGVLLDISGELSGMFMFLLDENFSKSLVRVLLGEEPKDLKQLDDMERSAVGEVGNVVCCSYINAISAMTGMEILVSVPDLCNDMVGAILSVPMIHFANIGEEMLLIENRFCTEEYSFTSYVLFLPERDSLDKMLKALGG